MKPRLFTTFLTAAFLVIGLLLLGGCRSNADAAAREKLDMADGHLENASEEFKTMDGLKKKSAKFVDENAESILSLEMITIIKSFKESAETALDEVEEARSQFKEALNMNISNDMKKYLNMKLKALDVQVAMLEKLLEAQKLRLELFEAQVQGIPVEKVYEYAKKISDLDKEANSNAQKAEAGLRDANEFYKEKNLDK